MQAQSRTLVNSQADFWLLGGLSIIMAISAGMLINWNRPEMMGQVYVLSYYLALVINYPHFSFSYQVFYSGLLGRLRSAETTLPSKARMIVAGFVVPVFLVLYFGYVLAAQNVKLLGAGVNIMTLLGGWHYARQGYGALITNSVYRGIFYSAKQKFILNASAYIIPIYAWLRVNVDPTGRSYYDVPYAAVGVPQELATFFYVLTIVASILSLGVFLRIWLIDRRGIPINGVIGYFCAIWFWVLLVGINPFLIYMAPCFHSLQYLPFIYKYKKGETGAEVLSIADEESRKRKAIMSMVMFGVVGLVMGFIFMDGLPKMLDYYLLRHGYTQPGFSRNFFLISSLMFISLHHYFIDYAFWRRDNKQVQQFVFRS